VPSPSDPIDLQSMATEVKQRNGAARSARVDDVPAQLGSSGGPTSAQPWGFFATARPPPEIDKQHQPFPGLALSCPYQPHATTSSACVLSPDAPYSPTRGSSTFSPTEALTILTSLGSGNRLAATIRGLLVPPPVVSDQDLRNPKLWDRFRANLAQERLRPLRQHRWYHLLVYLRPVRHRWPSATCSISLRDTSNTVATDAMPNCRPVRTWPGWPCRTTAHETPADQ